MLLRYNNEIIPLAQEWKHTYAGACRQSQVSSVNTPPHCFVTIFKKYSFSRWDYCENKLEFYFENSKYIPFMQTKEHTHTHLLNDPTHYFLVIKCGKEVISLSSTTAQSLDPSLRTGSIFYHQYIKSIKHPWECHPSIALPCQFLLSNHYICTTFLSHPKYLHFFFLTYIRLR